MPTKREKLLSEVENDNNFILSSNNGREKNEKQLSVAAPDSGFISSGNLTPLTLTEEIKETTLQIKNMEKTSVVLDSGIDLSERFSSLCIESSTDNNDLSSITQKPTLEPLVDSAIQEQDDLWKEYFQQDEDGDTFLHLAIIQGFTEVVLALIRMAPNPWLLDIPNDDAQTPIHLAVSTGHWKMVRWLIVAGAKPCPRNIRGDSPLHIAARNGDLMCCKAITDPIKVEEMESLSLFHPHQTTHRIDVDQWNYEGQTCVHVAAMEGHVNVLKHLIWHGADVNAREGRQGYTALHYAIERGDELLARFLLFECKQLDTDAITYGGSTALELGYSVPSTIAEELKLRGVPEVTNVCV